MHLINSFILQFDDESDKSAKIKEQCYTNKGMTSAIGEKLALMKTRLAAVRAGQSYEYCLREESQRKASASFIVSLRRLSIVYFNYNCKNTNRIGRVEVNVLGERAEDVT